LLLEGDDLEALLARAHREGGTSARIVRAEKVRRGGIMGFFAHEAYQVAVEIPEVESTAEEAGGDTLLPADRPLPAADPAPAVDDGPVPGRLAAEGLLGLVERISSAEDLSRTSGPRIIVPHEPAVDPVQPSTVAPEFTALLDQLRLDARAVPVEPVRVEDRQDVPVAVGVASDGRQRAGAQIPDAAARTSASASQADAEADLPRTYARTDQGIIGDGYRGYAPEPPRSRPLEAALPDPAVVDPAVVDPAVVDPGFGAGGVGDPDVVGAAPAKAGPTSAHPAYPHAHDARPVHGRPALASTTGERVAGVPAARTAPDEECEHARHPAAAPAAGPDARAEADRVLLRRLGVPSAWTRRLRPGDRFPSVQRMLEVLPTPDFDADGLVVVVGPVPFVALEAHRQAIDLARGGVPRPVVVVHKHAGGPCRASLEAAVDHAEGVVAVESDGYGDADQLREAVRALGPAAVVAVVDARRSAEANADWLDRLGAVDALAVEGSSASPHPAGPLALGLPVVRVDGMTLDRVGWAGLLCARLESGGGTGQM
jgi:hypothetical protein